MDPITAAPEGTFADVLTTPPPDATQAGTFQIKLSYQGLQIGWLNKNSSGWAVLSDSPLTLEQYVHSSGTYYKIPGQDTYMSVSRNAYVGFYQWINATTFHLEGKNLISDYNGNKLSFYSTDNGYLYAWNEYKVLDVEFVQ